MRIADCKSFTKVINLPSTASGVINGSGYVVSGGVLVELDDGINSNSWTPNHIEITFLPVSASIYSTSSSTSYPNTGYGWVHPWNSNMQVSSSFYGLHPNYTLATGAASYGKVAMLGKTIEWDFGANSSINQIRLFNLFGGAVVALINYSFQKIYSVKSGQENYESGSCGY